MNFVYSDINQIDPEITPIAGDVKAIIQSLNNIFNTFPGHRLFNPEFGVNFDQMLFETFGEDAELQLFRLIIDAIERYEPRVTINYGETEIKAVSEYNKYEIKVVLYLKGVTENAFEYRGALVK